jgi:hypothetical protein
MLTAYNLACGYIQRTEYNGIRIDLWHEGACYHTRVHDFNTHKRVVWNCHEKLSDARRDYKKLVKKYTGQGVKV